MSNDMTNNRINTTIALCAGLIAASVVGCSTPAGSQIARMNAAGGMTPQPAAFSPAMPSPPLMAAPKGNIRQAAFFTPSEPRQEFAPIIGQECPVMEVTSADSNVHRYPDEYLFDGGDRGMKVHYDNDLRRGVDTEDTFGEYVDHTGQQRVRASNPVAIYAPRFAAVRTMTGPEQDVTIDRLAYTQDANPGAGFTSKTTLATSNRRSKASGMRVRERGSELDTVDATIAMRTNEKAAGNVFVLKPLRRSVATVGMQFEHANEAWIAKRIQKAADWSVKLYPVVTATTAAAMQVEAKFKPQTHIGIEDKGKKGSLRIIKMVDRDSAVLGDVLTFTIEFENIGDKELYDVRITDNLTPRLMFIEDSGSSDRKGRIVVEDNDAGSEMLMFELEGKLEGGQKGVIEFKAKVL